MTLSLAENELVKCRTALAILERDLGKLCEQLEAHDPGQLLDEARPPRNAYEENHVDTHRVISDAIALITGKQRESK